MLATTFQTALQARLKNEAADKLQNLPTDKQTAEAHYKNKENVSSHIAFFKNTIATQNAKKVMGSFTTTRAKSNNGAF